MGDEDSDWEGFYLTGSILSSDSDLTIDARGMKNEGWNSDTPQTPTAISSFSGYYEPINRAVTVWM